MTQHTAGIRRAMAALALTGAATLAPPAMAQAGAYPSRPVTIVVPFQAGGGADTVARMLATNIGRHLNGQTVIVDNRAGASGNIGANYVSRAPADGYTLLLTNSTMTINAALNFTQGYDVKKDLQPLALLVSSPVAVGVNSGLPAKSIAELVAYTRTHSGKTNYSSCGNGSPQHFAGEAFNQSAKVDMVHVPYNGCAPAISDALGNQVPILFSTVPNMAPHAKTGKLRMLAVASSKRLSFMPDVPAMAETPEFKDIDITVWFGLFAPAATPPQVRQRIEQAVLATLEDPKLRQDFQARYYEVDALGADGMAQQVQKDLGMYAQLAKQAGIKLE
ncbi:MAG: tripartite tricarboxylate transporter substrate binding protein [Pigmentiphaga sp.]|uniref:tripartite tricarboxylate transporter substrate binding protein n=1 Tax=Pigmentiphaga sp. TaxID=1977564 RepID=UPI0029BC5DBA|nr:tripartite tricarboxylate transporter substrate binding protein [Pigmentiphaga sp.]MDX3905346.1 tripartite tricarboxylate transporter substrate binding protein [Pigmentiphaga sp.]